jgi:choline dehydrogenase
LRPETQDFDEWAGNGNPGWNWNDLQSYFNKIENDYNFFGNAHGQDGPVPIRRWLTHEVLSVSREFLQACVQYGFTWLPDLNQPNTTGVGILPMNMIEGIRQSAALAYLNNARGRGNLTLMSNTLVDKILFDGLTAIGVQCANSNKSIYGRNIVISAGTYATPAILIRSGIGSQSKIQELGIVPIADLPGVGQGLMDHPQCYIAVEANPGTCNAHVPCAQVLLRYTASGSSYLNDLQLSLLNWVDLVKLDHTLAQESTTDEIFMMMTQLERPIITGTVQVKDKSPHVLPTIHLDYCANCEDMRRLREGVRLGWEILHSSKLVTYVRRILGITDTIIKSDALLDQYIRNHILTSHHPMGTARMGPSNDKSTVVDHFGRVYGTKNLRCADASIIPVPLRANIHLSCMVIGEKMSDLILLSNESEYNGSVA